MRKPVPLGTGNKDYNSRMSRANFVNCYIEVNSSGDFVRIRRANGLRQEFEVGSGPIRGFFVIRNFIFVVSGPELYRIDSLGVVTGPIPVDNAPPNDLGGVDSKVSMDANGTDENQLMIVSEQQGFIYDTDTELLTHITDPNFFADRSVTSLNQIFWTNKPNSNEIVGSETANGLVWPPLRFASAEQNPDVLRFVTSKRSALWLMGSRTIEKWQVDVNDVNVPVRPILGATIPRGVGSPDSVEVWEDSIFFLADDFTVWMIQGSSPQKISDLNLEYAIKGDGQLPPYQAPERARAFFMDHPVHKHYVLTFPVDDVTWVFDVRTKQWHIRETFNINRWRGNASILALDNVLVGDYRNGKIYSWVEDEFTDNGETISVEMVIPAIKSPDGSLFINEIELFPEVGTAPLGLPDPKIQIKYSRDGGRTYKSKSDVTFGERGNYQKRVRRRQLGRTKQGFNFVLKFIMTDPVPFYVYELYIDAEKGM